MLCIIESVSMVEAFESVWEQSLRDIHLESILLRRTDSLKRGALERHVVPSSLSTLSNSLM